LAARAPTIVSGPANGYVLPRRWDASR